MPSKKKRPSPGKVAKPKRDRGSNIVDPAEVRKYFDEVHALTDKMETSNARTRQNIGKVYENCAAATKLTKKVIMGAYRLERMLMKEEARAQEKGTANDKSSYVQLSMAFPEDGVIAAWAKNQADQITDDDESGDQEEEAERHPAAERVGKVVALHGPS